MKARVLVVGYGVVGKRVADAVHRQQDMEVSGIVDVVPTSLVGVAIDRGFPIYGTSSGVVDLLQKNGLPVKGDFSIALSNSDIVIDTSPEGVTPKNVPVYVESGKPFIVNGGEKHELTGFSFSSLANYRDGLGKKKTRVVSCNTTSLCRIIVALRTVCSIEDVFVAIVRRAADPVKTSAGPINGITPVLGGFSHHAPDVNTVIPDIRIASLAVKVSTTLSHVHMVQIRFHNSIDRDSLIEAFRKTPRIILVSGSKGISSNAHIHELFRDRLRPRGDFWEVAVWEDSIRVEDKTAVVTYCVHMECIAIPENVDAVRAMLGLQGNPAISVSTTDRAIGCFKENAAYENL
jgi:glyceraldehyde-3-phosphate dehydrogenase (NAD(P))